MGCDFLTSSLIGHYWRKSLRSDWQYPVVVLVGSLSLEVVSISVMGIMSRIYGSVSSGNAVVFRHAVMEAVAVVLLLAFLKALIAYGTDRSAASWRRCIVECIHTGPYFCCTAAQIPVCNGLEQRITQDTDRLTLTVAQLLGDIAALPGVILFYSIYLAYLFDWFVVAACFCYFLFGSIVSYALAERLVTTVYEQEAKEGEFRAGHARYNARLNEILMLRGETLERMTLSDAFSALYNNTLILAEKKFRVRAFTNWFAYMASIVNYIVVGGAILHMGDGAGSEADRASRLAAGSYACLYLLNALSVLVASSKVIGETVGLACRVEELLQCTASYECGELESQQPSTTTRIFAWPWGSGRRPDATGSSVQYKLLSTGARSDDIEEGCAVELRSASQEKSNSRPAPRTSNSGALLQLCGLDVHADADRSGACTVPWTPPPLLIGNLSLDMVPGMRLLVTGPSGCGKSTLLRRICEAVAKGDAANISLGVPLSQFVVCPQSPYILQGTIEKNLCYPLSASGAACTKPNVAELRDALVTVGLGHLCEMYVPRDGIAPTRDWPAVLSPGEQQRLAVARTLVAVPALAVFDEATSALDEDSERALYTAICAQCRTLISIGHRSTIRAFHTHELRLRPGGEHTLHALSAAQ